MPARITGFATYIPARAQTSDDLARATGILREVIEEKFGLCAKPWGEGEQVSEMAVKAARRALDGRRADDIDVVLWTGSEHKDFPIWTAGIKVQDAIGARCAWAIDLSARCATTQAGLRIARDIMLAESGVRKALLAGGHRMIDKLNYANERARFLFTMSDAASAVLIERDAPGHEILATSLITDGSFSEDVMVPGGGTRLPLTRENFDPALLCLDVPDPAGMKARLDSVSLPNFLGAIERSVADSGYSIGDIGYLAIIHMKPSVHRAILNELGLSEDQTTYLSDFGHAGAPDVIRSLECGVRDGKIRDGDVVVLAGAGTGYIWAATTLLW